MGFPPSQKEGRKLNPPAAENNSLIALQVVLEYHHLCATIYVVMYNEIIILKLINYRKKRLMCQMKLSAETQSLSGLDLYSFIISWGMILIISDSVV